MLLVEVHWLPGQNRLSVTSRQNTSVVEGIVPAAHNLTMMLLKRPMALAALAAASLAYTLPGSVTGVEAFQLASPTQHTVPLSLSSLTPHHHRVVPTTQPRVSSTNLSSSAFDGQVDSLVLKASKSLTASSWLSWWSQLILTVVSSITFVFARNVMESQTVSPLEFSKVASKFVLPGVGIVTSVMSIIWTWGGRRLARRFVRRSQTSRVEAANLLRRVITVGVTINLIGLLTSLLGAQYIVGTLVAKAMQNVVGFGGGMGGMVASQTLQPLDVLVVQANTNILTSHFVSMACLLWLTRQIDLLDPPSLEDDV